MPIYERPTKSLMADWAKENLKQSQTSDPVRWFAEHYPKIKRPTVEMHVEGMSTNDHFRRHHPNVKPGKGFDLFYKLGPGQFRLWDPNTDPAPIYKDDIEKELTGGITPQNGVDEGDAGIEESAEATAFAYEKDLRGYLVKNLGLIEPGLHLYEEEEITGEEFPVGDSGRRQAKRVRCDRAKSLSWLRSHHWTIAALHGVGQEKHGNSEASAWLHRRQRDHRRPETRGVTCFRHPKIASVVVSRSEISREAGSSPGSSGRICNQ
jgi:hypothetical protein